LRQVLSISYLNHGLMILPMRLIYITTKNSAEAKLIASHLLDKKLIACANMFPIESMYLEDGEVQENIEFAMILKTAEEDFSKVEKEILKVHSYDTPAVFSWKPDKVNEKFDRWIKKTCNPERVGKLS
jgi:periplasmic divalent cation tolerance protein